MSIPTQVGVNTQGSPIYRFDAIPNTTNLTPDYNPSDYAQAGDNGDMALAINRAIQAASVGGGTVHLDGFYPTKSSIVLAGDNVHLIGSGFNTVIQPQSGATFDAISTPIPATQGLAGYTRMYCGVEHLKIDCSNMAGNVAGQGNALHFYGAQYCYVRDVWVLNGKNWAVLLDGDSTNFSFNNQVWRNIFDQCNAGVWVTFSEANEIVENQFKWGGAATAAPQPAFGPQDTQAYLFRGDSGDIYCAGNVFGNGGSYTREAVHLGNIGARIIGNRFDNVRYQGIVANGGGHMILGNQFASVGSAQTGVPGIQLGSSNNVVSGNVFDNSLGTTHASYSVAESGGPYTGNIITGNQLLAGATGVLSLNATSTARVSQNTGYNPVGKLAAQPAVPASGTAYTNVLGVDCTVYLTGGTFTGNHQIGGQSIGNSTVAVLRVAAGQSITLTYSAAPTWLWIGD